MGPSDDVRGQLVAKNVGLVTINLGLVPLYDLETNPLTNRQPPKLMELLRRSLPGCIILQNIFDHVREMKGRRPKYKMQNLIVSQPIFFK